MPTIYLITGPTQTEKTTRLSHWVAGHKDVGGLLSPILFGRRCFLDIRTQEWRPMEAEINERRIQQVGRYTFSAGAFEWANNVLLQAAQSPEIKWLVIDEIGPLELQGKGLSPAFDYIIKNLRRDQNLVLVIREKIAESIVMLYNLNQYEVRLFNPEA